MYFTGIITGLITFLLIGLFHPLVVLAEYHFGVRIWPVFLCFGLISCILSLIIKNTIINATFAIFGFCCFWSILEVFHQKKRVERGWSPRNPKKVKKEKE
ncbi:MAG: DUF4491 family protein [Spirochaetales bacterium]|jgi:hypothetical protein|nr:DUF4491 family protein [Spirochaetales bacterium]